MLRFLLFFGHVSSRFLRNVMLGDSSVAVCQPVEVFHSVMRAL